MFWMQALNWCVCVCVCPELQRCKSILEWEWEIPLCTSPHDIEVKIIQRQRVMFLTVAWFAKTENNLRTHRERQVPTSRHRPNSPFIFLAAQFQLESRRAYTHTSIWVRGQYEDSLPFSRAMQTPHFTWWTELIGAVSWTAEMRTAHWNVN